MTIEKIISIAEIRAEIASHVYGAELLLQHAMLNINAMERKINQLISERNALAAKLSEIERAKPVYWEISKKGGATNFTYDESNANYWKRSSFDVRPLYDRPAASTKREPLTDEQRQDVFRAAGQRFKTDPELSWRDAIVLETERAHGIGTTATHCRTCGPEGCAAIDGAPGDAWVIIGPDGSRFIGQSPHRAANAASKHFGAMQQTKNPKAAAEFTALLAETRRESDQQDANLMALYGSLNCPTCGGSGHVGDAISNCKSSTEGGEA